MGVRRLFSSPCKGEVGRQSRPGGGHFLALSSTHRSDRTRSTPGEEGRREAPGWGGVLTERGAPWREQGQRDGLEAVNL